MAEVERVLALLQEHGVKIVDLRFTDLAGRQRHVGVEAASVDHARLTGGILVDGSSLPGWREVTEADLLARPDLSTAWLDPFAAQPTLALFCDIVEPGTLIGYDRDPRSCIGRALAHLRSLKLADEVRIGCELGFWIFDDVRFEHGHGRVGHALRSGESRSDAGQTYASGNPGHRPLPRMAYLAAAPADHGSELRAEIVTVLAQLGVGGVTHRHGRSPCQHILELPVSPLPAAADRLQLTRQVIQQVAASYGKSATFISKPLAEEPGATLGLSISLWQGGKPSFAGTGYADLSPMCLSFLAGILQHACAISAFSNPTTNSWRRLRRQDDEPTLLAYAAHNRSTAIRVPYAAHPTGKRLELRFPDPCANPYLAIAATLMAGLDGVERKLDPGEPMDRNLYDLPPRDPTDIPGLPRSLGEALGWLESDGTFLTRGDVIPSALLDAYGVIKRAEINHITSVPHPTEIELYYGL